MRWLLVSATIRRPSETPSPRQAARLREGRLRHGPVDVILPAAAGPRTEEPALRVVDPDLVAPGHGDQDLLAHPEERPGRTQGDPLRNGRVEGARRLPFLAGPCEGGHLEGVQVDRAQQVVAG